jgi:hypothetical protein
MNRIVIRFFIATISTFCVITSHGQHVTPVEKRAIIDTLYRLLEDHYVYREVGLKMNAYIKKRQQQHIYDTVEDVERFASMLTADLRSISKDGHLGVEYSKQPIINEPASPPTQKMIDDFKRDGASDNFAFRKLEIIDGNIGYLKLNIFWPAEWIKETAAGAMAFLANSDAVILDLRDNHGFAGDGVLSIQSYFFEEPTHVSDYINRDDGTTRQSWTTPTVPGRKLSGKKLYILISHETFSAGEDFTYNMQALKRGIVVGEASGGGAHGTKAYRLSDHFSVGVPFVYSVNPVTKSDWEGKGVQPDIRVNKDDALNVAHIAALESIKEISKDDNRTKALQKIIDRLKKESGKK